MRATARWRSVILSGMGVGMVFSMAARAAGETGTRRMRATTIPRMELREARVDDALGFLRDAALTADPEGVGINIVYRGPPPDEVPRITLRLRHVTLWDALRYVTEISGLRFRVDERAVVITSADAPSGPIVTRLYPVQPSVYQDVIRDFELTREAARPAPTRW